MHSVFIDIETLPDPNGPAEFIEAAKADIKVPSDLTKPKLIAALELGDDGKFKTVPELKELWIEEFGIEQAKAQGEQAWRKTSFDGSKGQICSICGAVGDLDIEKFSTIDMSETELLTELKCWLAAEVGSMAFHLVAHNAKFDLPFIWHRSVINKVKPVYYRPHGRHGQHYYCTMEAWAGFNGRISMDNLAKALGIHGKGDMDGSMVYDTWQVDPKKVVDYCADDVRMLRDIYKRLEFES